MKVLQTLEKVFTFVIIRDNTSDSGRKYLHLFHKILATFNFFVGPAFLILFIYFDAKTFEEYTEVIYPLATLLANTVCFVACILNKSTTFRMIDELGDVIETRKLTHKIRQFKFPKHVIFTFELI